MSIAYNTMPIVSIGRSTKYSTNMYIVICVIFLCA
nr:MAG TPA: hypothetical protein [Caudoviricetes sp.]